MPSATAALGREGEPRRKGDPPLLGSQAWARAHWYKSRGSVQAKFNVLPVFSCLGPQALLGLHLRLDFILLWAVSYRLGKGWLSVLGNVVSPHPFPCAGLKTATQRGSEQGSCVPRAPHVGFTVREHSLGTRSYPRVLVSSRH